MTTLLFILLFLQQSFDQEYLLSHVNKNLLPVQTGKMQVAGRGMFLMAPDSINVQPNADVMLVCNDFSYVFEKFVQSESPDEKQKVTTLVYRGRKEMQLPEDSSFIFSFPVTLQWKPGEKNIPFKLHIRLNRDSIDTIIHNQNTFTLTEQLFKTDSSAALLAWHATPSDSKSATVSFLAIVPASGDKEIIEQQLKQLRTAYSKDPAMLRLLEKDLFERWLEVYQLR